MTSFVRFAPNGVGELTAHVDLLQLENVMRRALERAAIFLGYAVHSTSGMPLGSISLPHPIQHNFGVPDPIPDEMREGYQSEFRRWAIGQALTELDQTLQRYLAAALATLSDVTSFTERRERGRTPGNLGANSATLFQRFHGGELLPDDVAFEAECLKSLVNARNCLAHDSGVVSAKRLHGAEFMEVRWPGSDMWCTSTSGLRRLIPREELYIVRDEDVGSTLSIEDVIRISRYKEGEIVVFSPSALAELIRFYERLAIRTSGEMHRRVHLASRKPQVCEGQLRCGSLTRETTS